MRLVSGDNAPRSSRAVQASSPQNNEPVVLSSGVRRSPGRLQRQLWWDPGTRARTQEGGAQLRVCFFCVFFFLGRVGRLWSVEGLCVVGTPDLPRSIPPPPSNLFWLQKRPKQQNCHLQCRSCPWGRKKEVGNQWSCINLLTANVLHILILDPFPAVPQANRHCPSRAPPFLTPLHTGAQAKMPH